MRNNRACEIFLAIGLIMGILIGLTWRISAPTTKPSLAQLRYDARQICIASSQWKHEAAAQAEEIRQLLTTDDGAAWDLQPFKDAWMQDVQTYISDQRALEASRHITTPNYRDMASRVCPTNP